MNLRENYSVDISLHKDPTRSIVDTLGFPVCARSGSISWVVLKTKVEELIKDMGSYSMGQLEIE